MMAGSGVGAAKGTGGTSGPGPVSFVFNRRAERWWPLPVGPCVVPGMAATPRPTATS